MENYSLSDLATVAGNNDFGGNFVTMLIVIFLLVTLSGGFGYGNRNGEFSQFATSASQNELLLGQKFDALGQKVNSIGDGLSSLGYAQLQNMNAMQTALGGAITSEGRAIQTQLAECCCGIKEAVHSEGEATRAMMQQNKIESLQAQLNTVQTQQAISNAMCGVPKINPYMYGIVPNYNGCSCGSSI